MGEMAAWDISCLMLTGMMSALRQHCTNMHAEKAHLLHCNDTKMRDCIINSDWASLYLAISLL